MKYSALAVVLAATLQLSCSAQAPDQQIYNRVGVLKGQVTIVNHPELGRTPASGWYFVLQRTDCVDALTGVRTDIEGRYEVYLGFGRYRLISYEPTTAAGGGEDLLSEAQVRQVRVESTSRDTEFDIEVALPEDR